MANGWSADSLLNSASAITVGASQSNSVLSKEYAVTARGALHHVVAIDVSAATVATGITAKLQSAIGSTWQDSKTVAITTTGRVYIKLNVEVTGDQTFLPLLNKARIVVTTGAGDSVTVSAVQVLQEL